ncbi:MAG: GNAT family N-acetyltransferase [Alphaproteobacteria bacterium]|nr:GNAT family N-acetyltransferase [Alphaproteobacteria bacterium]
MTDFPHDAPPMRPQAIIPSRIRVVQRNSFDIKILTELHQSCFTPGWSEKLMSDTVCSPINLAVFALQSPPGYAETIAGFLIAQVIGNGPGQNSGYNSGHNQTPSGEAEILSFGVLPEFRRLGLARLLLHDITRRIAGMGVRNLFLEVAVTNLAARSLYENSGFRQVGERKNYYPLPRGQSEDALVLRRDLAV